MERERSQVKKQTLERQTVQLSPIIPSGSLQSHSDSPDVNNSASHQPNPKVNQSQTYNMVVSPIIPSQPLYSHTSLLHVNESQPNLSINQPQPAIIKSPSQSNPAQPINQDSEPLMSPPANKTPATSPTIVENVDDNNQIWIVPEGDRFDPHKVVIDGIAKCTRSKFELARPSWKKFPESTHEMWFEEFKEMKVYWESDEFKTKSERNKENHDSNASASLHTGGCVPHRLIYKRMNEFERKKQEILVVQSALVVDRETNLASQPTQLSEMDIWVQSVGGKKKGRVKGLDSLGQSVKTTNSSTSTFPKEIDEMIKSQVDASNADLYAQLQNEQKKNKRMRKELHLLMKHVYNKSSSNDERLSQEDYQDYEDESNDESNDVNQSYNPDNVNKSDSDPDGW
ncbi:putative suppressor protein SRP40-like isoform X2 [Capsicum annuum]|nr:putative suppressor protein SRP40-like isoform X2 [Capsicum annuum]